MARKQAKQPTRCPKMTLTGTHPQPWAQEWHKNRQTSLQDVLEWPRQDSHTQPWAQNGRKPSNRGIILAERIQFNCTISKLMVFLRIKRRKLLQLKNTPLMKTKRTLGAEYHSSKQRADTPGAGGDPMPQDLCKDKTAPHGPGPAGCRKSLDYSRTVWCWMT